KNYKNFFSTMCKYFPYLLIILLFIFFQSIVIHRQMFFLRANNLIFYPILLLPWLLTMKNRIFKIILMMILIIAVVLSVKRSALIFTLLSVLIYVYYEYSSNERINRLKGYSIAIFVIAITAGVFINIYKQYDHLILSRFEN